MKRHVWRLPGALITTLLAIFGFASSAWSQQLATRVNGEGWFVTEFDGPSPIYWRIIEDQELCGGSGRDTGPFGGTAQVEIGGPACPLAPNTLSLDLGRCGCKITTIGVFRHRGAAVTVLEAEHHETGNDGHTYFEKCFFGVRLSQPPAVAFRRQLSSPRRNGWSVPSRPLGYEFVPLSDLLLVVMVGPDGALPWPIGESPATQASLIATIMPLAADTIAGMPEEQRSRLAPVATLPRSWSILEEPFSWPPIRVVVGTTRLGRAFSTRLSYDGPRLEVKQTRGTDNDKIDPWPDAGFPLADYRWKDLPYGPQVADGEVELMAFEREKELSLLRWPCKTDPHGWDQMREYELPEFEEWIVELDTSNSANVRARSHLVRTCLAFQVRPFFHGRGGAYRTFENATIKRIVENGRTVGVEVHHGRPRILFSTGANPLPDERDAFRRNWPNDEWWQPFFEGTAEERTRVFCVD